MSRTLSVSSQYWRGGNQVDFAIGFLVLCIEVQLHCELAKLIKFLVAIKMCCLIGLQLQMTIQIYT